MTEERKAAIYARYSSDNQRDESIDAQIAAMETYAKNNNIRIVATYIDRAKSATSDQRPSFQEMIKMSETGLFDTIMVHKLDRFARSKYDSAIYKQKLKANKVQLVSVTEQLDGSPESIILESVLEAMAEYYSKNLAREVRKGLNENAKSAMHTGGVAPLGYDIVDKKLVVNEKEAHAVKIIFEMYADGHSYSEIINVLNGKGFLTKKGKQFFKNSLTEILRNEKYRGVYIYNKSASKSANGTYNRHAYKPDDEIVRIEGGCPAIVSNEIFEAVKKRQTENLKKFKKNKARQKYLLSGLVFCGVCGSPMHANKRKRDSQLTFRCSNHGKDNNCKEINMAELETIVLKELKERIFSVKRVRDIMQVIERYTDDCSLRQQSKTEDIEARLAEVVHSKENILKAVESGIVASHFSMRLDELKIEEEQLRAELVLANQPQSFRVTETDVKLLINRFNFMVKEFDSVGLRKIILDFVKKITVTNCKAEVELKISFGDLEISDLCA